MIGLEDFAYIGLTICLIAFLIGVLIEAYRYDKRKNKLGLYKHTETITEPVEIMFRTKKNEIVKVKGVRVVRKEIR